MTSSNLTWKTLLPIALVMMLLSIYLSSVAKDQPVLAGNTLRALPNLPFEMFGSIPPLFLFFRGLTFSDSNPHGLLEAALASACALLALVLIVISLIGIFRNTTTSRV